MSFLTDVFSSHLNSSGVIFAGPCRIAGYQIKPGGTAGQIDFYNNGSAASGDILLSVDVSTNTAIISTLIPGDGIRFSNGCYVDFPSGTSITAFYG